VGLRGLAAPLIAMSLAASLGVLPLIAWTFHIVSPWSVLANVMLVPLAWLGVTLGFAGFAVALPLSAVWAGAGVLLKPAVGASWVLERAAAGAASVPGAFYYTAGPPAWLLAAWYAGLAAFVHRERLGLTPRRLGVGALALANAFVFDAILPGPRRLEATCFDVRHGSCVLLRFPSGETLLYDCGTTGALFDVGAYVAAPALWEMGIRRIDALVLSHPDADHINGVISLAKRFRIGRAFVSPYFGSEPVGKFHIGKLREAGVEVAELAAGDGFSLGDAEVRVLGPPRGRLRIGRDANNRSLVVRVECRGRSFLLPGDVEDSGTAWLLSCGPAIRSDVLLMPHHGALQEQSRELVDAVRPAMAIISSGRGETEPAMIELLREAGCEVLQTGERGAISVTAEDGGLRAAGFAR